MTSGLTARVPGATQPANHLPIARFGCSQVPEPKRGPLANVAYKLQATILASSGISADNVTNTWHLLTVDDMTAATWSATLAAFNTFYSGASFGFSPDMSAAGHTMKLFKMSDPEPRVPQRTGTFSISLSGGTAGPSEIAICLSGKENPVSGGNIRKQRGRVYLGPWGTSTFIASRVPAGLRTQIVNAAKTLHDAILAISPQNVVMGVTSGTGTQFHPYDTLWVDDAWDIQRRRGVRPTARSTVTVTH
jgi:hypothetical protein